MGNQHDMLTFLVQKRVKLQKEMAREII